MKIFNVRLRDGAMVRVKAQRYRHEGDQYVFESDGESEVQFFVDSEVVSIIVELPDESVNLLRSTEGGAQDVVLGADAGG